jgi:hypothetical protein
LGELIFLEHRLEALATSYSAQISQEIRGIRVTITNPFQDTVTMEQDRSLTGGYRFNANAELTVEDLGAHVTARLYELSREHCRLHVSNPFPVGTQVLVKIYAWPHFLQVHGTICHSDVNGVAVAFSEIESRYVAVLNACLLEIEQKESDGCD